MSAWDQEFIDEEENGYFDFGVGARPTTPWRADCWWGMGYEASVRDREQ
jgi:hypothetical protein